MSIPHSRDRQNLTFVLSAYFCKVDMAGQEGTELESIGRMPLRSGRYPAWYLEKAKKYPFSVFFCADIGHSCDGLFAMICPALYHVICSNLASSPCTLPSYRPQRRRMHVGPDINNCSHPFRKIYILHSEDVKGGFNRPFFEGLVYLAELLKIHFWSAGSI